MQTNGTMCKKTCDLAHATTERREAPSTDDPRYYADSQFDRQLDTGDLDLIPDEDFGEPNLLLGIALAIGMWVAIGLIVWATYFGINYILTVPFGSVAGHG